MKLMAKLTRKKKKEREKGELGSGKPYDERSEMETALDIPVASWGGGVVKGRRRNGSGLRSR